MNEDADVRAMLAKAGWPQLVAITDILRERARQDEKFGQQNHDPITYSAILTEEVGELAQAALENYFGGKHGSWQHLREEAVQTAAVALAIIECLDRGQWSWPIRTKNQGWEQGE